MNIREFRSIAILTTAALSPLLVAVAQTPSGTPGAADKMFLHKAANGGYAEVQLGQLAARKGNSEDVKKFGQKMVDDHTALNEQMKPFVEQAGLQTPGKLDKKDQAEYDKLNGLSGDAFDKEYIAYMVKDHHADLHEFRHEEATTEDASLKDAVAHGESVIKEHNELADNLAKQMGVPVASHHRSSNTPATE